VSFSKKGILKKSGLQSECKHLLSALHAPRQCKQNNQSKGHKLALEEPQPNVWACLSSQKERRRRQNHCIVTWKVSNAVCRSSGCCQERTRVLSLVACHHCAIARAVRLSAVTQQPRLLALQNLEGRWKLKSEKLQTRASSLPLQSRRGIPPGVTPALGRGQIFCAGCSEILREHTHWHDAQQTTGSGHTCWPLTSGTQMQGLPRLQTEGAPPSHPH